MNKFGLRSSKFRHVYGQPYKKENGYDEVKIAKSSWDSPMCAVNPKFLAIITESVGGGSFIVLPLSKTGRTDRNAPKITGHRDIVLDISWCPFNDHIIASASADCSVKIWEIPEDGLTVDISEALLELKRHQKKCGVLAWHPTASNILASGGADNLIVIWNIETAEAITEIQVGGLVYSLSWNYNGSRIASTSKDKKLRMLDPRSGDTIAECEPHDGAKGSQCVFLKNNLILTTGFSRSSERQLCLWNEKTMGDDEPMSLVEIDNSNGVLFPFYDPDNSLIYLCGKGDCLIRYYEVTTEEPYVFFLSVYTSNTPMRGFGYMHKRGLNVNSNEIARFYKLHATLCEVIPFTVPRKSELFQDDLYPDTAGDEPALTCDEWIAGKNADPILISLKGGHKPANQAKSKLVKKTNILANKKTARTQDTENSAPTSTASGEPAAGLPPHVESSPNVPEKEMVALGDDLAALRQIVEHQGRRIEQLEASVAALENADVSSQGDDCEQDV